MIAVGEMRDLETMRIAVAAAETGHLVLATVHATDVAAAVARVVDAFPGSHVRARTLWVLDRDDVPAVTLVDLRNEHSQRRGFARPGRAGDEHETAWQPRKDADVVCEMELV